MDKICEQSKCYGCGACAAVCPVKCIELKPDKRLLGHIYPIIDKSKCIDCGRCVRVCPSNNPVKVNASKICYAAYINNNKAYINSSSGGLAWQIAEIIVKNGGSAYGAVIDYGEKILVNHHRIENINEIPRLQGSKYVQSTINQDIFKGVLDDLKSGKDVVFFGTGCQIASLKSFLNKPYQSLVTVDIICHGVPSLSVLNSYLKNHIEVDQIKNLRFRNKNNFDLSFETLDSSNHVLQFKKNLYAQGFMKCLFYRSSCYSCPYAQPNRTGDITLGDFWGLKKNLKNSEKKRESTSLVLINTKKGLEIFARCASQITFEERPISEAVDGNKQLRHASKRHYAYSIFRLLYSLFGFKAAAPICLMREQIFYRYALPFYYKHIEKRIWRK